MSQTYKTSSAIHWNDEQITAVAWRRCGKISRVFNVLYHIKCYKNIRNLNIEKNKLNNLKQRL
jgi:hypothetical protein